MRTRTLLGLAALAAIITVLPGCGSSNEGPDNGRVFFVNALTNPANTPVSVRVNGLDTVANLAGNTVASATFSAPTGSQSFQVLNTATNATIVNTTPVTVQSSIDQLVIATGSPGGYQLTNLGRVDLDTSNTALTGNARVYFVNAAANAAGGADFSFAVQGSTQPGSPIGIQDVLYNRMTNETLVAVGTGPAVFSATANGTTVQSAPITLEGTKTYVVVLFPTSTGTELKVFKLN